MKQIISGLLGAALLAVLSAAPACAQEVKAGDLVITQAWSRATPGGAKIGGGYLTIENKGATPDRLIGGSGAIAGKIEVHEMSMKDGVMTMRPLDNGLTIEPGKTVKLAPGGLHLMLFDLKAPLKQGDKVPITLEFEKAGKVTLSLDVQSLGAQGPASADHPDGKMDMKDMPGMKMLSRMLSRASVPVAIIPDVLLPFAGRGHIRVDAWVTDHQKITLEDALDEPVRQTFTGIFRSGAVCDAFAP